MNCKPFLPELHFKLLLLVLLFVPHASGCWGYTKPGVSHQKFIQIAEEACIGQLGWLNPYGDANIVIFEETVIVEVFENRAEFESEDEHPNTILVTLDFSGRVLEIDP